MSAAEVIEQIKELPPEEVRAVTDYLRNGGQDAAIEYAPVERLSLRQR